MEQVATQVDVYMDPEKKSASVEETPIDEYNTWRTTSDAERRLLRRIDIRLVPASMLIYLLSVLDKSNIGNAKILNDTTGDSLAQTLRITDTQYTDALMVFIVAYSVFETPSIYLLKFYGPKRWIPLIMFCWGVITMILGAVHNFAQLTAVRFLLGAVEAGLFPGLAYYVTFWYRPEERALRLAMIVACASLAGAFGGAIAFATGHMNGALNMQAWRWLFILEGLPACLCAIAIFFMFPDYPETATWLSSEERALAVERLKGVSSVGHAKLTWSDAQDTILDWRLYLHYFLFFATSVPFASISLFAPTIVSGLGFEGLRAQLFTVPPYAISSVVTLLIAWQFEKREMRSLGIFVSFLTSGIGFLVCGLMPSHAFKARYALVCLAIGFGFSSNPLLLSWLPANLRNTGAITLAIPLNTTIANLGQIIGVYIFKTSEAPAFPTGFFTNAAFLFLAATVTLILRGVYVHRNKKLSPRERVWSL